MKRINTILFCLWPALLALSFFGCELENTSMNNYEQAKEIVWDLSAQSRQLLPKDFGSDHKTITYTNETWNGDISGSVAVNGSYNYSYWYYSTNYKTYRYWTYTNVVFDYNNYKKDDTRKLTIVSGQLTVNGSQDRESGTFTTTVESGAVTIKGTVTIIGFVDGKEIRDTVTLDIKYEYTGGWYYNGKISNSEESYNIVWD